MVSRISQEKIQLCFTESFIGEKEKSFLESCLQIEENKRKTTNVLLLKSLFNTGLSTSHSKNFQGNNEKHETLVQQME